MSMDQSFLTENETTDGIRGSTWGRVGTSLHVGIYQDGDIELGDGEDNAHIVRIEDLEEIISTAKRFLAWKDEQRILRNEKFLLNLP